MKKLALSVAIAAATISFGANANGPRPVNTGVGPMAAQMVVVSGAGNFDITAPCPSTSSDFAIDASNPNLMQMNGDICLEPNGPGAAPFIRVSFNSVTGVFTGGSGTVFGGASPLGGSIEIDIGTTTGYVPYGLVDVFTTTLDCTNATGINGLQVVGGTTVTKPGFLASGAGNAICSMTLFGTPALLYIGQ